MKKKSFTIYHEVNINLENEVVPAYFFGKSIACSFMYCKMYFFFNSLPTRIPSLKINKALNAAKSAMLHFSNEFSSNT